MSRIEPNVNELIYKTSSDFRGLAFDLNTLIEKSSEFEHGRYKIKPEERHLIVMLENMKFVQKMLNKGIQLLGGFETNIVEVYDYQKVLGKIEKNSQNFKI